MTATLIGATTSIVNAGFFQASGRLSALRCQYPIENK
jgi:hypothetical protein